MNNDEVAAAIHTLMHQQVQAVLATHGETGPMMHLMAYAFSQPLDHVYIASRLNTRKVENLLRDPRASMLWDNRTGNIDDHVQGYSLLAECEAERISLPESKDAAALLSQRNTSLKNLLALDDCCCFRLNIKVYNFVLGYKEVYRWIPND